MNFTKEKISKGYWKFTFNNKEDYNQMANYCYEEELNTIEEDDSQIILVQDYDSFKRLQAKFNFK